mmetsp:Transcript_78119/g.197227  ORF Transcript_78119/g.197227 Transcript_78119/m.197227 type:complete len:438 (-) Transcript_78119:275-1588(-)
MPAVHHVVLAVASFSGVTSTIPPCAVENFGYQDPEVTTVNGGLPIADAQACQISCKALVTCKVFTYYVNSGGCWLQGLSGNMPLLRNITGVWSGPRECLESLNSTSDAEGATTADAEAPINSGGTDALPSVEVNSDSSTAIPPSTEAPVESSTAASSSIEAASESSTSVAAPQPLSTAAPAEEVSTVAPPVTSHVTEQSRSAMAPDKDSSSADNSSNTTVAAPVGGTAVQVTDSRGVGGGFPTWAWCVIAAVVVAALVAAICACMSGGRSKKGVAARKRPKANSGSKKTRAAAQYMDIAPADDAEAPLVQEAENFNSSEPVQGLTAPQMLPLPTISAPIPTYSPAPYVNMGSYGNMAAAPMATAAPVQMQAVQMAPMAYAAPVAYAQPNYSPQVAYTVPVSYAPPSSVMVASQPDLFDRLDANHDGVLSRAEFAQLQ